MNTLNTLYATLRSVGRWLYHTTAIVFLPVTILLVLGALQTTTLTLTCNTIGMGCPYALSSDKLVSMYAGAMMSLQGSDEFVPNDKRRASR
jgi:hypothetical protein